jgi:hypothetical protein
MKLKIISLISCLFAICVLFSCNKHDFNYPEGTVGISKIVSFPAISIIGSHLVIIDQGGTFSDSGATAIVNGASVQYTVTGSVDPNTPGVYMLSYSAQSTPPGYSSSDWRTVVVIGSDVSANDFSGTYLRSATGITSTWTKTAEGVYSVENPGGATVGVGLKVIAVNYTGTKITIPQQISPDYGQVSSASESYNLTPLPVTYSWIFFAAGYGTSLRTFVKQ